MSSNKRQSVLPRVQPGPKAPVNFSPSITIADTAILTGSHTINVSSESVVHPRSRLDSTRGRVTVGRRCIVHERVHIGAAGSDPTPASFGVLLEDYVTVEVAAVIESGETTIAEGTVVGIGARIGRGAKIGKHCTITAKSVVQPGEVLPDYTVLYTNGTRRTDRREINELKNKAQAREIEVLRRLIPSNPAKFKD
ncbi:putative Trimeric LpxA-like protein [Seiridium cardinale]|uniref:Dynactin subunit 6 n=1 Tax=Seiridium cardinale TaxID=138064 RepID=A0ABR2X8Z5_9PEZI